MDKKIQIKGIVRVPSDIVKQVLDDNPAEFKKVQKPPQFHDRKNVCYLVQASLRFEGQNYMVTQELGSADLSIGYNAADTAPDTQTQRKIRKIISEKYF